ncbi:unnamed protein product [Dovyalis caffra]|uniref:Uncharacterized protein n=1 Tax=Dovyalis caffra TaxID=77055 RepID=A0AAV1R7T2_9ROSI|nr:unnamed protein product [Dovyalis caffra]
MEEKKEKEAKKPEILKERDCEDWCFVCKDGGELILCDFECCVRAAKFLSVRGDRGLCEECLEYVQCVEGKDDVDADGGEIDLTDRDTYECLFLEYWEIIKEAEGLTWDDVILAELGLRKRSKRSFKSTKIGKSKNDGDMVMYDNNLEITKGYKTTGKRKGSKPMEYDGWGSKELIEFLRFLGKDTTKELSQYEVNSIICSYIKEKELFDPEKKKKVLCDEWLRSVFRRKSLYKNGILNLLEYHFTANLIDSQSEEDENMDEVERSLQDKNEKNTVTFKRQKTMGLCTKSEEMEAVPKLYESGFASIVAENIKLVYLRRGLVEELLKERETFEGKTLGSFVKVKNDPRDPSARNLYKLSQVTGIKQSPVIGENKSEILLRVSSMPMDVCFSMLSDLDLSEEDIEGLRQIVEEGLHPKPTIIDIGDAQD